MTQNLSNPSSSKFSVMREGLDEALAASAMAKLDTVETQILAEAVNCLLS